MNGQVKTNNNWLTVGVGYQITRSKYVALLQVPWPCGLVLNRSIELDYLELPSFNAWTGYDQNMNIEWDTKKVNYEER